MPSGQGLDIPPASAAKRGRKPRRYAVKFARAEVLESFSRTDQDQLCPLPSSPPISHLDAGVKTRSR